MTWKDNHSGQERKSGTKRRGSKYRKEKAKTIPGRDIDFQNIFQLLFLHAGTCREDSEQKSIDFHPSKYFIGLHSCLWMDPQLASVNNIPYFRLADRVWMPILERGGNEVMNSNELIIINESGWFVLECLESAASRCGLLASSHPHSFSDTNYMA